MVPSLDLELSHVAAAWSSTVVCLLGSSTIASFQFERFNAIDVALINLFDNLIIFSKLLLLDMLHHHLVLKPDLLGLELVTEWSQSELLSLHEKGLLHAHAPQCVVHNHFIKYFIIFFSLNIAFF